VKPKEKEEHAFLKRKEKIRAWEGGRRLPFFCKESRELLQHRRERKTRTLFSLLCRTNRIKVKHQKGKNTALPQRWRQPDTVRKGKKVDSPLPLTRKKTNKGRGIAVYSPFIEEREGQRRERGKLERNFRTKRMGRPLSDHQKGKVAAFSSSDGKGGIGSDQKRGMEKEKKKKQPDRLLYRRTGNGETVVKAARGKRRWNPLSPAGRGSENQGKKGEKTRASLLLSRRKFFTGACKREGFFLFQGGKGGEKRTEVTVEKKGKGCSSPLRSTFSK